MGKEKKKGDRGMATTYYSRSQAMKKLQISMPEFRRLCIFKGVHPQEPRRPRKVNKGSSIHKTYYYRKDIKWLAHEPLLEKSLEFKVFMKKLRRAINNEDNVKTASLEEHRPLYTLDHIVKERYPTFIDALRDVDDALNMVALYASLVSKKIKSSISQVCKRLLTEFMHYIIISRSLRKVFISVKGMYYQVEVHGQTITWLMPHQFPHFVSRDVDFRIMDTFVEFYITLITFVNYKLFNSFNLRYPPQIDGLTAPESALMLPSLLFNPIELDYEETSDKGAYRELLESLSTSLLHKAPDIALSPSDEVDDDIPTDLNPKEQAMRDKAKDEQEKIDKFKKLFERCRFFLSREVPKESLTFIIRSFGGVVSWDPSVGPGSTYGESDDTITHHVADRPVQTHVYLTRIYVQPQWIYDSVNYRHLLPVDKYQLGVALPPHLSPFTRDGETDYIPPDKKAMIMEVAGGYLEDENSSVHQIANPVQPPSKKQKITEVTVGTVISGDGEVDEDKEKVRVENEDKQAKEEKRLSIMMMTRKRKKLYDRIMKKRNMKNARVKLLQQRRQEYEEMKQENDNNNDEQFVI